MWFKVFLGLLVFFKESLLGQTKEKTFDNDFTNLPPQPALSNAKPTWSHDDPRAALFERLGPEVVERLQAMDDPYMPRPLVSLEQFFEGNDDYNSIMNSLPDQPSPAEVFSLLKELRSRDDVHDVLIEVREIENPDGWPFSDTIWFITTATPDDVTRWFSDRLSPDDVIEGFKGLPYPLEPYFIEEGYHAVGVWYDV